jgi:hypothetical protein
MLLQRWVHCSKVVHMLGDAGGQLQPIAAAAAGLPYSSNWVPSFFGVLIEG